MAVVEDDLGCRRAGRRIAERNYVRGSELVMVGRMTSGHHNGRPIRARRGRALDFRGVGLEKLLVMLMLVLRLVLLLLRSDHVVVDPGRGWRLIGDDPGGGLRAVVEVAPVGNRHAGVVHSQCPVGVCGEA